MLIGGAFGLVAAAGAAGVGSAALATRSVAIQLEGGDYALLLAGCAAAAALWAAIGVGLGAVVRSQVSTVVGICAWLLFIESLLHRTTFVLVAGRQVRAGGCLFGGRENRSRALRGSCPDRRVCKHAQ